MSKWNVMYSESARQDLRKIYQYIAYKLLTPKTAANQADRIMNAIESLCEMPKRYPKYDKEPWKTKGLRKLVVDNYLVFYILFEQPLEVLIVSIMYGGRNIDEALLHNSESEKNF